MYVYWPAVYVYWPAVSTTYVYGCVNDAELGYHARFMLHKYPA